MTLFHFDFDLFNMRLGWHELPDGAKRIAAICASFYGKNGQHPEGLAMKGFELLAARIGAQSQEIQAKLVISGVCSYSY